MAKHTEDETWDKLSEIAHNVLKLKETQKYLAVMQTEPATEDTTPITISYVPSGKIH